MPMTDNAHTSTQFSELARLPKVVRLVSAAVLSIFAIPVFEATWWFGLQSWNGPATVRHALYCFPTLAALFLVAEVWRLMGVAGLGSPFLLVLFIAMRDSAGFSRANGDFSYFFTSSSWVVAAIGMFAAFPFGARRRAPESRYAERPGDVEWIDKVYLSIIFAIFVAIFLVMILNSGGEAERALSD